MDDVKQAKWPIGLYAPGGYSGKCNKCGKQHIADKRAQHCADCTLQDLQARVAELEAERDREKANAYLSTINLDRATVRAYAAEALLSDAVKAGMLEAQQQAANLAVRLINGFEEMTDVEACRTIGRDIRAHARNLETIARIVAQVTEGRG